MQYKDGDFYTGRPITYIRRNGDIHAGMCLPEDVFNHFLEDYNLEQGVVKLLTSKDAETRALGEAVVRGRIGDWPVEVEEGKAMIWFD